MDEDTVLFLSKELHNILGCSQYIKVQWYLVFCRESTPWFRFETFYFWEL